ncbi:hypothetical protein CAEBREN_13594 [Caenorhabditis brenneri]|uniref:Uncharacterized protein n=1 Tax=Caenorhabditis brenneri TaxID=135651 RepID=G0NP74_CAEBE|nr:hypothetical protein CAEBREN_13594 [Caenorhabditis brenneri]
MECRRRSNEHQENPEGRKLWIVPENRCIKMNERLDVKCIVKPAEGKLEKHANRSPELHFEHQEKWSQFAGKLMQTVHHVHQMVEIHQSKMPKTR